MLAIWSISSYPETPTQIINANDYLIIQIKVNYLFPRISGDFGSLSLLILINKNFHVITINGRRTTETILRSGTEVQEQVQNGMYIIGVQSSYVEGEVYRLISAIRMVLLGEVAFVESCNLKQTTIE